MLLSGCRVQYYRSERQLGTALDGAVAVEQTCFLQQVTYTVLT